MSISESRIEETPAGAVPSGSGWFVLSLIGARGFATEGHGVFCTFESPDADFEDFGINVHVLAAGRALGAVPRRDVQEGFLVLAGECIAVVEEQERALRAWDYLHCPAGTTHAMIGAGDGPCAILMVGARKPDATIHYPVSEAAARHGLSTPVASDAAREAYGNAGWNSPERADADALAALSQAAARSASSPAVAPSAGARSPRGTTSTPLEPEPARHRLELGAQLRRRLRRRVRLGVRRLHAQRAAPGGRP